MRGEVDTGYTAKASAKKDLHRNPKPYKPERCLESTTVHFDIWAGKSVAHRPI